MLKYSWFRASLVAQLVKNLPAMQETLVESLGQEDPLEKEMAIHSSTYWNLLHLIELTTLSFCLDFADRLGVPKDIE